MAKRRKNNGVTLEGMSFKFYNKKHKREDIYTIGYMQGRPGKVSISDHQVFRNGTFYKWIDYREIMRTFNITSEEAAANTELIRLKREKRQYAANQKEGFNETKIQK